MRFVLRRQYDRPVSDEDVSRVLEGMGCTVETEWYPAGNVEVIVARCGSIRKYFLPIIRTVRIVEELKLYELSDKEVEQLERYAEGGRKPSFLEEILSR